MRCIANKNNSDINKILSRERERTARLILVALASVLTDKYGYGKQKVKQVIKSIIDRADSINEGYISLMDLEEILLNEYDIVIK